MKSIWQLGFSVALHSPFPIVKWKKNCIVTVFTKSTRSIVVIGWPPRKDSSKIFLTLDESFFLVSFTPTPSSSATFPSHLSLFPVGLTSLYLCFRVATAALWIMETPHPYSKQHTEAQMLAHKHTSISVSNLQAGKQQMSATPVTSARGTIYLPARSHV